GGGWQSESLRVFNTRQESGSGTRELRTGPRSVPQYGTRIRACGLAKGPRGRSTARDNGASQDALMSVPAGSNYQVPAIPGRHSECRTGSQSRLRLSSRAEVALMLTR